MKLFYEKMPGGNFGDDMNAWFWNNLIPGWQTWDEQSVLFGIGTIINEGNFSNFNKILVLGSGLGYGKQPLDSKNRSVEYGWVRGPKTAKSLGLDKSIYITDPAILTPRYIDKSAVNVRKPIFIPHATTAKLPINWDSVCDEVGLEYVTPKNDYIKVIESIRDAEYVIAESMHAAIIADAFRIPWTPISISNQFNTFKWEDWSLSLDMNVDIFDLLHYPKEAYSKLKEIKYFFNRYSVKNESGDANQKISVVSSSSNKEENNKIKNIIGKYSYFFESYMKRGLIKSKKLPMYSSALNSNQRNIDLIDERICQIKNRYGC